MKQATVILYLLQIMIISCKNDNENKIRLTSDIEKTYISDTSKTGKTEADNFLIDNTSDQNNGSVYMYCEKMPEFPGGEAAFIDYLKNNIKYPALAVSDKVEGRVIVKFIIRPNGEPDDVQIIRKVRTDMDDECLRVIRNMPKWKPGLIDEKPVSVSYSISIRYILKKVENLNGIFILPVENTTATKD